MSRTKESLLREAIVEGTESIKALEKAGEDAPSLLEYMKARKLEERCHWNN